MKIKRVQSFLETENAYLKNQLKIEGYQFGDKTNIYLEAAELVDILTYQRVIDKENKFMISINDSQVNFEFLGIEGYVYSADFEGKRLVLKIDPNHEDKNQQYVWKTLSGNVYATSRLPIRDRKRFIGDWRVTFLLT